MPEHSIDDCPHVDEAGMPKHLPMPVNADGQGPLNDSDPDIGAVVCWCGDPRCCWTQALAQAQAIRVHASSATADVDQLIERARHEIAEDRHIAGLMKQQRNRGQLEQRAQVTEELVDQFARLREEQNRIRRERDVHERAARQYYDNWLRSNGLLAAAEQRLDAVRALPKFRAVGEPVADAVLVEDIESVLEPRDTR